MRHFMFIGAVVCIASSVYAEGLQTLIETGRSAEEMQRAFAEETKVYQKICKAIASGDLKKGETKENIVKRYGEPVAEIKQSGSERERWIYKPASASHFGGEKVYLLFDKDGLFDEYKIIAQKKS